MNVFPASIPYFHNAVTAGPIAVNYFYVLSGFIMSIAYYRPQHAENFHKWKYWLARIARIYPVYLVALLLIVAAKYRTLLEDPLTLPLHLTMLQAWIPGYPITLNTPGWSLSVEAFFYLCFPFLLLNVYKNGAGRLIILGILLWLITQLVLHLALNSSYYQPKNLTHDFIYYHPLMHINSFIIGIVTGIFFKNKEFKPLKHNTLLVILSAGLIVVLLMFKPSIENLLNFKIAFTNGLIAPVFLLFIVLLSLDKGIISKLFSHKWLVLLGEASFSLYILQKPLHGIYDRLIAPRIDLPETLHFYIFVFVLILFSIASYKWFETPMRKYINSKYHDRDSQSKQ